MELNYPVDVAVLVELVDTFSSPTHNADLANLAALTVLEAGGVRLYRNLA